MAGIRRMPETALQVSAGPSWQQCEHAAGQAAPHACHSPTLCQIISLTPVGLAPPGWGRPDMPGWATGVSREQHCWHTGNTL